MDFGMVDETWRVLSDRVWNLGNRRGGSLDRLRGLVQALRDEDKSGATSLAAAPSSTLSLILTGFAPKGGGRNTRPRSGSDRQIHAEPRFRGPQLGLGRELAMCDMIHASGCSCGHEFSRHPAARAMLTASL
eukprot:4458022-Prymnesium_polylepis.1